METIVNNRTDRGRQYAGILRTAALRSSDAKRLIPLLILLLTALLLSITIRASANLAAASIDDLRPDITQEDVRLGDTFTFGSYEQDNNTGNGLEPIDWIILEIDGDKVLALSQKALETKMYDEEQFSKVWRTSTIRRWLNADFYDTAFTQSEKRQILTIAEDGSDTVFLLNSAEADQYLIRKYRRCEPTAHAITAGAYIGSEYGTTNWWIRSTFYDYEYYSEELNGVIDETGEIKGSGDMHRTDCTVRPAIWVQISAILPNLTGFNIYSGQKMAGTFKLQVPFLPGESANYGHFQMFFDEDGNYVEDVNNVECQWKNDVCMKELYDEYERVILRLFFDNNGQMIPVIVADGDFNVYNGNTDCTIIYTRYNSINESYYNDSIIEYRFYDKNWSLCENYVPFLDTSCAVARIHHLRDQGKTEYELYDTNMEMIKEDIYTSFQILSFDDAN